MGGEGLGRPGPRLMPKLKLRHRRPELHHAEGSHAPVVFEAVSEYIQMHPPTPPTHLLLCDAKFELPPIF